MSGIPADIFSVEDYANKAQTLLSKSAWAFVSGAAMDGLSHNRNRQQLDQVLIQQRILCANLAQGNCQTELFDKQLKLPLLIAPLAYQKLAHELGEVASIKAAFAQGAGFCLSTLASSSIEDTANAAPDSLKCFQLYYQPDRSTNLELIQRAENADYQAIIITVDAPINGIRNNEQRANFVLPENVSAVNLATVPQPETGDSIFSCWMQHSPTWDDISWIRTQTKLPILLKGVMHPDDARQAISLGVDGVIVSNHGGRVLDSQPASIEVLPAIRQALGPDVPILLDSGIRRGSDIFKAIALGADAVLLGRPVFYALAVAGPFGVAHMLRILRDELEATMVLSGCASLDDINQKALYCS